MNKDFTKKKLLAFSENKQIKTLYDLASFIEESKQSFHSNHFEKLKKYHLFLEDSEFKKVQILNKEFFKIKDMGYQFQIYLMNLKRLLGQSKKEYDFIVSTKDLENKLVEKFPIICLLDSVRSAHNIGAIFRNSECFGIEKIILTGLSPTPDHPQVIKTAMGCDQHIDWSYAKSALEVVKMFKIQGYSIFAIETGPKSISINQLSDKLEKVLLIFGHEQFGISKELLDLSDKIIEIPLYGTKNSLNVSVCQGVILNKLVDLINGYNKA